MNVFEKFIILDRFGFVRILIDLNFCFNYLNVYDSGRLFELRIIKKIIFLLCVDKLIFFWESF